MRRIFNVPIEIIEFESLANRFFEGLVGGARFYYVSANPEILVEAARDPKYKRLLRRSKCNFADGVGLVGAYYFNKKPLAQFSILNNVLNLVGFYFFLIKNIFRFSQQRLTGIDFFVKILNDARINKYKIFLLGGNLGVLTKTKKYLLKLNKNLNIIGFNDKVKVTLKDRHIEIDKENFLIEQLNDLKPDIIFIGLSHPKQEYLADYLFNKIKTLKFAMGVGGTFDYLGGRNIRAPAIVRKLGFEWLWRLFFEPRKRFCRILKAVIIFPWSYLNQKI